MRRGVAGADDRRMLTPLALILPALAGTAADPPRTVTYDMRLTGDVAYAHNQSYEGGAASDEKTVSFRLDALLEGVTFKDGKITRGFTSATVAVTNARAHSRHVTNVGQTVSTCDPDPDSSARSQGSASLSLAPYVNDRVNLDPSWLNLTPFMHVAIPATCVDNQGGPPNVGDLDLSNTSPLQDPRAPFSWQFKLDPGRIGEQQLSWKANRIVPTAACPGTSDATVACNATFKGQLTMNRVPDEQLAPAAVVAPSVAVAPGGRSVSTRARCRQQPACAMEVWIYVPPKRRGGRARAGAGVKPLAHRTLSLSPSDRWSTITVPLGAAAQRTALQAGGVEVVVEGRARKAGTVSRTLTAKVR